MQILVPKVLVEVYHGCCRNDTKRDHLENELSHLVAFSTAQGFAPQDGHINRTEQHLTTCACPQCPHQSRTLQTPNRGVGKS